MSISARHEKGSCRAVFPLFQTAKLETTDESARFRDHPLVDQTSEEDFKAINNPRGWWSENIEGNTDKLGDEWTYRNEDVHRYKLKVTELIPGKKVVWRVLDNYFNFIQDQKEWIGTDVGL